MKTFEVRVTVTNDGQIILPALPQLEPGEYDALLVFSSDTSPRQPLDLPIVNLGAWLGDPALRRDDLYDDGD